MTEAARLNWRERVGAWLLRERIRSIGATSTSGFTITGGVRGGVQLTDPYSQHPVVNACVKLLADNVAQVPFKIVKSTEREARVRFLAERFSYRDGQIRIMDLSRAEGVEVVYNTPYNKLFDRPNPLQSGNQFWQAVTTYLTYSGECDIYCEERTDVTKVPTGMIPVDPSYFEPKPDRELFPVYWRYNNPRGGSKNLAPYELIRPRLFNPNDLRRGLSPIQVALMGLTMDWNARLYNKAFFENDATPGGFIFTEHTMKKKQREQWLKGYFKQHQGSANAFKWALLEGVKDIRPTTLSPKDAQFQQLMKMDKEELAMIWRVPLVLLSRTSEINYATDKAERRALWTTTLIPIIKHLEDIFWSELFMWAEGGQYWGVFDLSQVEDLQEDIAAKLEQAESLNKMNIPFNMINERLGLGFEPVPGGDTVLVNMNMIPLEAAIGGAALETTEQGDADEHIKRVRADKIFREFEALRKPLIDKFLKAYRSYLLEYRKAILDNIDRHYLRASWEELYLGSKSVWDQQLIDATSGVYREAFEEAIEFTYNEIGATQPFLTMTSPETIKALENRQTVLAGTNTTMRNNLRNTIAEGMAEQETVKQIKDRVKKTLNFQDSRALTIARTEMGSATSEARFLEMKGQEVKYASWSTAGATAIPLPRRTHLEAEALGPQPIGKTFGSTGCRYPHDPLGPADQVINCRCVLVPEVGKKIT